MCGMKKSDLAIVVATAFLLAVATILPLWAHGGWGKVQILISLIGVTVFAGISIVLVWRFFERANNLTGGGVLTVTTVG